MSEEKYIKSYDGELLYAKEYIAENAKATVILTHDMKEHSGLYEQVGEFLSQNNINVFTYDLRSHKNSAKEPFGTYSNDFFNDSLRDLIFINKYLQKKYNLPIINIGVGCGATLIVRCNQFFKDSKASILIGMPYDNLNIKNIFFRTTTKFKIMFINKNSEAKLTNKIINNSLSSKFEDGNYQSSNKNYIEQIKNDKFCNYNVSANILNSLFRGNCKTYLKKNLLKINKDQNILLINGEYDIVTNFNKSTKHFIEKITKLGYMNINNWTFQDMRHNILNEVNTNIVLKDIVDYIFKLIKPKN